MNIEKSIQKIVNATIKDIMDGKYKLIEIGTHNSIIEYKGNSLNVWIANEANYCTIKSNVSGMKFPEELPSSVKEYLYNMATTPNAYMVKAKLKQARKEQKESYKTYKGNVLKVKGIKEELIKFK